MALTQEQEIALLALLDEKLVMLDELPKASHVDDSDLFLTKQNIDEKSVTAKELKGYVSPRATTDTVGIVKLTNEIINENQTSAVTSKAVQKALSAQKDETIRQVSFGRLVGIKTFTESGIYEKPEHVTHVKVIVTGGGGAGKNRTLTYRGGGGGAGGTAIRFLELKEKRIDVQVGKGATEFIIGDQQTTGETSSFGPYLSATGGMSAFWGAGGMGGFGHNGDINLTGGFGSDSVYLGVEGEGFGDGGGSGDGGASYWGGGFRSSSDGIKHNEMTHIKNFCAFGSGGGGASDETIVSGADGVVYIEEYA